MCIKRMFKIGGPKLGQSMLAAVFLLALNPVARAGWRWERTEIRTEARPKDGQAEATFRFENIGLSAIKIQSVKGGCSCLKLAHSPEAVAPGAKGFVKATFVIGQRRGLETKLIVVKTDDPKAEEAVLSLTVDIKEPIKVTPALVFWRQGEEPKAKTVNLTIAESGPVQTVKATPTDPRFSVTVTPIEEGRAYRLSILPQDTHAPASCQVAVETTHPGDQSQTCHVFAYVK